MDLNVIAHFLSRRRAETAPFPMGGLCGCMRGRPPLDFYLGALSKGLKCTVISVFSLLPSAFFQFMAHLFGDSICLLPSASLFSGLTQEKTVFDQAAQICQSPQGWGEQEHKTEKGEGHECLHTAA